MRLVAAFLLLTTSLLSAALPERDPWLSSFLDVSLAVDQSHRQSSQVDTQKGTKRAFFHSEKTSITASAVPMPEYSASVLLDLTRTQSKAYGFDALALCGQWSILSDFRGDLVSLTAGGQLSFSPSSRISDLSSQNHSPLEAKASMSIGKELGYSDSGFYRLGATGLIGKGSRGSAWLGANAFVQRVIQETHYISLFFESEHGLSSHRIHSLHNFRGWATVGYTFGDIGVRYELYKNWFGVLYTEVRGRIFAEGCLSHSWGVQLGIQIPLQIF